MNTSLRLKKRTDREYKGKSKRWWAWKKLKTIFYRLLPLSFTNPHPWAYYIAKEEEEGGDVE